MSARHWFWGMLLREKNRVVQVASHPFLLLTEKEIVSEMDPLSRSLNILKFLSLSAKSIREN